MSYEQSSEQDISRLIQKVDELGGRVAELEQRVAELENSNQPALSDPRPSAPPADFKVMPGAPPVAQDELLSAIAKALEELGGQADAGAIRTQLAKSGLISVTRSDVNKALYAHKDLFTVVQQDGMKPIWKKA